jgi:DNA-binding CsgD family transcriptional regulator
MFGKEYLFIIKSIKKTKFYILKILIKIGDVRERTLINHKRYKKDYIFHLENINRKLGMFGKDPYIS